jgi:DNA-binding NarL/FixJ family response regulator
LIRVEVVARTLSGAQQLAAALAEDELLEVVCASVLHFGYRPDPRVEVVIALEVVPPETPASGPKVVLISKDGRLERGGSIRASLRLDALPDEIAAAAVAAHAGLYSLTSEQMRTVPEIAAPDGQRGTVEERLTPREIEVLRMMADGSSNKEIGTELHISSNTAKFHVAQVLAKLGVSSRAEAVRVGIRRGLVLL